MAEDCFLCSVNHDVCKYTKGRNIGEKAIKTLQKVANSQNNELLANALSEKTSVWVADVCYKRYSDPRRTNKPAANVESFFKFIESSQSRVQETSTISSVLLQISLLDMRGKTKF